MSVYARRFFHPLAVTHPFGRAMPPFGAIHHRRIIPAGILPNAGFKIARARRGRLLKLEDADMAQNLQVGPKLGNIKKVLFLLFILLFILLY